MDVPTITRAQGVVLDEFLAPQEMEELVRYTLAHESDFRNSSVVSPTGEGGKIDFSHRRSRVLTKLGRHAAIFADRVRSALPGVLEKLGMQPFSHQRDRGADYVEQ